MGEIVKMNKSTGDGKSTIDMACGHLGDMTDVDVIKYIVGTTYLVATMPDDELDSVVEYVKRCRALSDHEIDLIGKLVSAQSGSGQTIEESEAPEMYDLLERFIPGIEEHMTGDE